MSRPGTHGRARRRPVRILLPAASLLAASCVGLGPRGAPEATEANRTSLVAALVAVEDHRDFDPVVVGRSASSGDPWVRSRAALACGRLRDIEASIYLPVLLRDPDPTVRRAAAFASGVSGDKRLVRVLENALADGDPATASSAATALGRLGGDEAEAALRRVLAGPAAGPREAAAAALFRARDTALVPLLAGLAGEAEPGTRRAAAWSLARNPRPGSEDALRGLLDDADAEVASWAARGLGLLGDSSSAPRLALLAKGAEPAAVEALFALERIAAKGGGAVQAREAGLALCRDSRPGVAVAALTLLRRAPADPDVRGALEAVVDAGGRRGGVALASLAALDPDTAFARAFPRGGAAPLDLRLGAAEALPLLAPARVGEWLDALLADASPRVRMEAVSRLPRDGAAANASRLARALADSDGAVKAAALDAAAPLASGKPALPAMKDAWRSAYAAALASREPDLVASALDAAATLADGGRELVAARRDDPDDLVRDRSRRLLVERFGEDRTRFVHEPVSSSRSASDYRRLAERTETGRVLVTFTTTRGSFSAELLPKDAPMTVDSFVALARKRFFDGTTIHRVVPGFVVQGGDPRGDGTGGPGYALRDELNPRAYVRGTIGMALSGPDTGGSQWFVTLSRQPHLDGAYTVFGEVTAGMEVVDRIEQNDRLVSVRVEESAREAPPGPAVPSR